MNTTSVALGDLIDRAIFELESPSERGASVVLGETIAAGATAVTLSAGELNVSDVIELGSELIQIIAKSTDPTPTYTLHRGFYSTTAAAHASGDVATVNPQFARRRIAEAIGRAFPRLEALGVPMVKVATLLRETGDRLLEVPAEAVDVIEVIYISEMYGDPFTIDGWRFMPNLPTAKVSTGKALKLPWNVSDTTELEVVYRAPYSWDASPVFPSELATITMPSAAVDLPAQYAAAWLVTGREVSRGQLDRAEEFAQQEPTRLQSGTALARLKWQEFYRSLDEAARVVAFEIPKHRPVILPPRVRRSLR